MSLRRIRLVAPAAVLAGGLLVVPLATAALADNPASATTSTGQTLTVGITSPADGSSTASTSQTITGTASIGSFTPQQVATAFVTDVSGSTSDPRGKDCNGDGIVTGSANAVGGDNLNGDAYVGDTLDCEIGSVRALIHSYPAGRDIDVSLIALGSRSTNEGVPQQPDDSAVADLDSTAAVGTIAPYTDTTDLDTVEASFTEGTIGKYSIYSTGAGTNYNSALFRVAQVMNAAANAGRPVKIAYFTSDGFPNQPNSAIGGFLPGLTAAKATGTKINTYAVNQGTSTTVCDPTAPLGYIAAQTGGTCTVVSNPGALSAAVTQPTTLTGVTVSVNGGPAQPTTVTTDGSGNGTWSTNGALALPRGADTITATATASDGTAVTATSHVYGLTGPSISFPQSAYGTNEGSGIQTNPTVTDTDPNASLTYGWTGDAGLTFSDAAAQNPTITPVDNGAYHATLTVTDTANGLSTSSTVEIDGVNVAPSVGAVTAVPGQAVTNQAEAYSAPFTDPGTNDTHSATIDCGDGTGARPATVTESGGNGTAGGACTYATGGARTVTITVTDKDGGVGAASTSTAVDTPPTVSAGGPYDVNEGSDVTLSGSSSDADPGDTVTYAWTSTDGAVFSDPTSPTPTVHGTDDAVFHVTLIATDSHGVSSSSSTTITVHNVAPTVSNVTVTPAGSQPGQTSSLTASFADPGVADTHTATIAWGDGTTTAGTVDEANHTVTGSHAYARAGTYTATVTVTDDDNGVGSASAGTPVAVNTPPVANAGPDKTVAEGSNVTLQGSGSDADGDALTYSWSPTTGLSDPTVAQPSYHGTDDGSQTFTLKVCDTRGACSTDDVLVTTTNVAPTVTGVSAPAYVSPTQTFSISATFTDPGVNDTHAAVIAWGDGTTSAGTVGGSNTNGTVGGSHAYAAGGTYTITVTVTDKDGGSGSGTAKTQANRPPVANAGPDLTVAEGSSVTLQGSGSDPDGDPITYAWTPASAVSNPSIPNPTYTGIDDGSQTLTLTVTDRYGASSSDQVVVKTTNVAPTVTSFTGPAQPAKKGTATTVSGTFSDPGTRDTHTASVDWGDGTTSAITVNESAKSFTGSHTYANPGLYNPTVTVTDDDGGKGSATLATNVVVYDPNCQFVTGSISIAPKEGGTAVSAFNAYFPKKGAAAAGVTSYWSPKANVKLLSTSYDYLTISGAKATWQGKATVNGKSGYSFLVSVIDAQHSGAPSGTGTTDLFRIRIFQTSNGATVYDTQPGAADSANPITKITCGGILIA